VNACVGTILWSECSAVDVVTVVAVCKPVVKMGSRKAELEKLWNALLLGLPFFFWGTNMVVMEAVTPKTGVMFVAATRLIPAGPLILAFAMSVQLVLYTVTIKILLFLF